MSRILSGVVVGLVIFCGVTIAVACSVPVFRYALERWPADRYAAYLVRRGPLDEAQQQLADKLGFVPLDQFTGVEPAENPDQREQMRVAANVHLIEIDLDSETGRLFRPDWSELSADKLPQLIVEAPFSLRESVEVWAGDFTQENFEVLLDSPARREVARRLLAGDSAVWVLLESGDQEEDDARFELLKRELAQVEQQLQLPEVTPEDAEIMTSQAVPLKIKFTALRVGRDDPAERRFVEMLLRVEPDLMNDEIRSKPMVFPLFGRGRALYALVGGGILPETIDETCQFLISACQCTVKQQSPGVDLLIAVDWQRALDAQPVGEVKPAAQPELVGLTGISLREVIEDSAGPDAFESNDSQTGSDETKYKVPAQPDATSNAPPADPDAAVPGSSPLFGPAILWTVLVLACIVGVGSALLRK